MSDERTPSWNLRSHCDGHCENQLMPEEIASQGSSSHRRHHHHHHRHDHSPVSRPMTDIPPLLTPQLHHHPLSQQESYEQRETQTREIGRGEHRRMVTATIRDAAYVFNDENVVAEANADDLLAALPRSGDGSFSTSAIEHYVNKVNTVVRSLSSSTTDSPLDHSTPIRRGAGVGQGTPPIPSLERELSTPSVESSSLRRRSSATRSSPGRRVVWADQSHAPLLTPENSSHSSDSSDSHLSAQEIDTILDLTDPRRTGYTYAQSRGYRRWGSEEWEIPRMSRRPLYATKRGVLQRVHDSIVRTAYHSTFVVGSYARYTCENIWNTILLLFAAISRCIAAVGHFVLGRSTKAVATGAGAAWSTVREGFQFVLMMLTRLLWLPVEGVNGGVDWMKHTFASSSQRANPQPIHERRSKRRVTVQSSDEDEEPRLVTPFGPVHGPPASLQAKVSDASSVPSARRVTRRASDRITATAAWAAASADSRGVGDATTGVSAATDKAPSMRRVTRSRAAVLSNPDAGYGGGFAGGAGLVHAVAGSLRSFARSVYDVILVAVLFIPRTAARAAETVVNSRIFSGSVMEGETSGRFRLPGNARSDYSSSHHHLRSRIGKSQPTTQSTTVIRDERVAVREDRRRLGAWICTWLPLLLLLLALALLALLFSRPESRQYIDDRVRAIQFPEYKHLLTRSEATAQAVYSKAVGGVFYVVDLASHGLGETGSAMSSLIDGRYDAAGGLATGTGSALKSAYYWSLHPIYVYLSTPRPATPEGEIRRSPSTPVYRDQEELDARMTAVETELRELRGLVRILTDKQSDATMTKTEQTQQATGAEINLDGFLTKEEFARLIAIYKLEWLDSSDARVRVLIAESMRLIETKLNELNIRFVTLTERFEANVIGASSTADYSMAMGALREKLEADKRDVERLAQSLETLRAEVEMQTNAWKQRQSDDEKAMREMRGENEHVEQRLAQRIAEHAIRLREEVDTQLTSTRTKWSNELMMVLERLDVQGAARLKAAVGEEVERVVQEKQSQDTTTSRGGDVGPDFIAQFAALEAQLARRVDERVETRFQEQNFNVNVAIDWDAVRQMIKHAIAVYDADKTARADFALESAGAQVVSIRCSETYDVSTRRESIWGIPLFYVNYSPRVLIQRKSSSLIPGECWAFKGSVGYFVVQLSALVNVTTISYEHIAAVASPEERIASAPREFEVYSLQEEIDPNPHLLGKFVYDDAGEPLQFFDVQYKSPTPTRMIELKILSNYGHPKYTCLYRLRVHGKRAFAPDCALVIVSFIVCYLIFELSLSA